MTADDRLRDTFDDLRRRVADDVRPTNDPSAARARGGNLGGSPFLRPGLAIAGLAVIVAGGVVAVSRAGDGDGQEVATDLTTTVVDGDPDETGVTASTPDGDPTATPDDDGDGDDPTASDDPESLSDRYRVATEVVAADTADPFLNVRTSPDAGADLLAKLPATYTGLAATGRTETADDGGTWIEVDLLHPVRTTRIGDATGRPPAGWVNTAFVEELPDGVGVTLDEVPACAGGGDIDRGTGLSGGYVYGLDSALVEPSCLRVVVTFAQGSALFDWDSAPEATGPAAGLPTVLTTMSGGLGASLDLGPIGGAWRDATESGDVYAVRATDGTIDLVTPRPVDGVTVTGLPERGIAVVDFDLGAGSPPPAGAGVVLTGQPLLGRGTVEVTGLARPFEANLSVHIEDPEGRPVDAVFSGSDFLGTRLGDAYGVGTTDWIEAWGTFSFRAEGLAAGDYVLVLNAEDAVDDPEVLRVPVTLDDGGEAPPIPTADQQQVAMGLVGFARGGDAGSLSLADEVILLLGESIQRTATAAELADPAAWVADVEAGFGGFDGPFSPLDRLTRPNLRYTAGPVPFCAGPPKDWPTELDGLDQVNIEPVGIDSCIQWFGVHLFLDPNGDIAAVSLDLFGP